MLATAGLFRSGAGEVSRGEAADLRARAADSRGEGGEMSRVEFFLEIPDLANPSDWHDWWQAKSQSERPKVVLEEADCGRNGSD